MNDPNAPDRWRAGRRLAKLLSDSDDPWTAEQLLLDLAQRADRSEVPRVWLQLAHFYVDGGRPDAAAHAFERAAQAEPAGTPDVLINLAAWWASSGAIDRAANTYRQVADEVTGEDRPLGALARYRLGHLYEEMGDVASASACWRAALPEADESLWPHVAIELAGTLATHGCGEQEVRGLLTAIINSDHPDLAPAAALMLARRARDAGEFALMRQLCELVLTSEHPEYVVDAREALNDLSQDRVRALVSDLNKRTQRHIHTPPPGATHEPSVAPDCHVVASSGSGGVWVLPQPDPRQDLTEPTVVCSGGQLTYVVGVYLRAARSGLESVEINVALHVPAVMPGPVVSTCRPFAQWELSVDVHSRLARSVQEWIEKTLPVLTGPATRRRLRPLPISSASRLAGVARSFIARHWSTTPTNADHDLRRIDPGIPSPDPSRSCDLEHIAAGVYPRGHHGLGLGPRASAQLICAGGLAGSASLPGWPSACLPSHWLREQNQLLPSTPHVTAGLYSRVPDGYRVVDYLQSNQNQKQLPSPRSSPDLGCCH